MAAEQRTELEQDIIASLVESKAVDFEAAGSVLAKFGAQAALTGVGISFTVTPRFIRDWCIPVDLNQFELGRFAGPNVVAGP